MTLDELRNGHCKALKGPEHALPAAKIERLRALLPGWELGTDGKSIRKAYKFPDFLHALAFVNALGWMAERENHHPDLELGWGRCSVAFSTHDVGGLSMNDFVSAAKTDALLDA